MRNPDDRDEPLPAVPLLLARAGGVDGADVVLAPDDDVELTPGDELLLVGASSARRLLEATLLVDATREYVVHGRHVPASWVWRKLTRPRV